MNKSSRKKENVLKWLKFHQQEIINNQLAMNISKEDEKLNDKIYDEIQECIDYVKEKL
jgi:hypothetical protein